MDLISEKLKYFGKKVLTDIEIYEKQISEFKISKKRKDMILGDEYYRGKQDILNKKRLVLGEDGSMVEVDYLPNSKIVNNQYSKMVDQKKNYFLGQPFLFKTKNKKYNDNLKKIFNKKFIRLFKNLGEDCINCGIAWLYLYYNENGEFSFKRFKPYEIIAGWKDSEHTILDYAIRIYEIEGYEGKEKKTIEKVEIYKLDGIYYYTLINNKLIPDVIPFLNYFNLNGQGFNWQKIPLIPFKYNDNEIPLINKVKALQDGLNEIISSFQDGMLEDKRNSIFVLTNYDGENLAEFRRKLSTYGAVKVRSTPQNGSGDVKVLEVDINAGNYNSIIELFKKAIIENANGYDAKDDRLAGNPNQMNILSMYSDIELDCNEMETEYQSSMEDVLWFVNNHFINTKVGNFENESVGVIFNRNIMISVGETIQNINSSVNLLSKKTLLSQHPWIDDVDEELSLIEQENKENEYDPFNDNEEHNHENKEDLNE